MFWRFKREPAKKAAAAGDSSVFERLQREQIPLWNGIPLTVCFDYQPYLKHPVRRRVNVSVLQQNAGGEQSLLGYCHDVGEDRVFKVGGIRGSVLVEKVGEELAVEQFLLALRSGSFD